MIQVNEGQIKAAGWINLRLKWAEMKAGGQVAPYLISVLGDAHWLDQTTDFVTYLSLSHKSGKCFGNREETSSNLSSRPAF